MVEVVDGQQRIITICLLLVALRHRYRQLGVTDFDQVVPVPYTLHACFSQTQPCEKWDSYDYLEAAADGVPLGIGE